MKIMQPVIAWLRQLGCRIIMYIDDNLLMATSKEEARLEADLATKILEALGFVINYPKSTMEPCQIIEFLGFTINSTKMTISIPEGKMKEIQVYAIHLAQTHSISGREIARFVAKAHQWL